MSPIEALLSALGEKLAVEFGGKVFGSVRVVRAESRVELDSEDKPAIFLRLTLSNPSGETWPQNDIRLLRHAGIEFAKREEVPSTIYVSVEPVTDAPQAEDDNVLSV